MLSPYFFLIRVQALSRTQVIHSPHLLPAQVSQRILALLRAGVVGKALLCEGLLPSIFCQPAWHTSGYIREQYFRRRYDMKLSY